MTQSGPRPEKSNAALWARLNLDARALVSAHLCAPHSDAVTAVWSQRDPVASKKHAFLTSYIPDQTSYTSSQPAELAPAPASKIYPSPSRRFYLRFVPLPSAPSKSLLAELWSDAGLEFSWPIKDSVHGSVYTDDFFGSVAWSPDERFVAYIADTPAPSSDDKDSDPASTWAIPLRHKFQADSRGPFGELYVGSRSPALYIADVHTGAVALAAHPPSYHLGEPQWSDSGWIVCTARHTAKTTDGQPLPIPDDLGIIYCYNRLCSIVAFKAPDSFDAVSCVGDSLVLVSNPSYPLDYCCNSPRFSPDGRDLIYISAPRLRKGAADTYFLPHNTTKILRCVSVAEDCFSRPVTLIGVPEHPKHDQFPGLYLHGLVQRPWLRPDTVVLTTTWGFSDKVIAATFDRRDGVLVPVADLRDLFADCQYGNGDVDGFEGPDIAKGSVSLLDVYGGNLLVAASDPASPRQLLTLRDNGASEPFSAQWVSHPSARAAKLRSLVQAQHCVSLIVQGPEGEATGLPARLANKGVDDAMETFQVSLLLPTSNGNDGRAPLAVFPHGGPHTASLNGFTVGAAALLACGFAVMYVNYRGSLGLGQKSLESLLGRIGTQDVIEVAQATRWALNEKDFKLDSEKTVFVGGSHSGFIGAHTSLIPGLFKRTVLRNPVVNVASMAGASDIPDWTFAETAQMHEGAGGGMVPDDRQLGIMYRVSPVSKVIRGKERGAYPRTLLQVGASDKRVPPTQSLEWRRLLNAVFGEGVVTVRWYEVSQHPIDDVCEGDDAWVQALDFLCEVFE